MSFQQSVHELASPSNCKGGSCMWSHLKVHKHFHPGSVKLANTLVFVPFIVGTKNTDQDVHQQYCDGDTYYVKENMYVHLVWPWTWVNAGSHSSDSLASSINLCIQAFKFKEVEVAKDSQPHSHHLHDCCICWVWFVSDLQVVV